MFGIKLQGKAAFRPTSKEDPQWTGNQLEQRTVAWHSRHPPSLSKRICWCISCCPTASMPPDNLRGVKPEPEQMLNLRLSMIRAEPILILRILRLSEVLTHVDRGALTEHAPKLEGENREWDNWNPRLQMADFVLSYLVHATLSLLRVRVTIRTVIRVVQAQLFATAFQPLPDRSKAQTSASYFQPGTCYAPRRGEDASFHLYASAWVIPT
ncbi:hypothetical protein F5887DRAFT_915077 [Amanita rubescens]|nr:hypothetical protein F5887DRAFT_915077 [Amanita rubescens]